MQADKLMVFRWVVHNETVALKGVVEKQLQMPESWIVWLASRQSLTKTDVHFGSLLIMSPKLGRSKNGLIRTGDKSGVGRSTQWLARPKRSFTTKPHSGHLLVK